LDVSGDSDDHPVLVLERVQQGSIAALLAQRAALECGEAVTILAPIAALVGELHGAGVAHGRLGVSSIHLGSQGEPVLLGLGHCELFPAGGSMAAIDTDPAAASDRDALAALALGVLSSVRAAAPRVLELTRWIEGAPRAYEFPSELAERLFACAEPLPVVVAETRPGASAVPARLAPPAREPVLAPVTLPELLENPLQVVKNRAMGFVRGVRPRFWIAAAGVAIGLILAIALIPSAGAPKANPVSRSRALAGSPAPSTPAPSATPLPDDPLLASKILLGTRSTCIRDLSILCLDNVDEASSAAFASDAALIQQVQSGGEVPSDAISHDGQLTLTERLGDTALIGLGQDGSTASILAIKTRTGWRIRDYLSGAQATPPPLR
jgi:hypothetical protein